MSDPGTSTSGSRSRYAVHMAVSLRDSTPQLLGESALKPTRPAAPVFPFLHSGPYRSGRFASPKPTERGLPGQPAGELIGFDAGQQALLRQDSFGGIQTGRYPPFALLANNPATLPIRIGRQDIRQGLRFGQALRCRYGGGSRG